MNSRPLHFEITMRFRADARLTLECVNDIGRRDTIVLWDTKTSEDVNYFNDRYEMNQSITTYRFNLNLNEGWEVDLTTSYVEFGYIDRRSYNCFCRGPFRKDYLISLNKVD